MWQRDGRLPSPNEGEPGHRSLRIGGIGDERFAKGPSRRVEVAEFLPRFPKREPGDRPMGRALERLLEQLRRRAQVALFSSGFGVGETTLGDQVPRREGIAHHAYSSSLVAYAGAVTPLTSCFEAGGYGAFVGQASPIRRHTKGTPGLAQHKGNANRSMCPRSVALTKSARFYTIAKKGRCRWLASR